jgi:hypothetical protein
MICRVWRGWTIPENAQACECVVRGEVGHAPPAAQAAPKPYEGRAAHNQVLDRRPQGDHRT